MAETFNDGDELAKLKEWWSQNGLALVLGVVVGLLIIGGWYGWHAHANKRANASANLYYTFNMALHAGKLDKSALHLAQTLKDNYAGTPYAAQASMDLARYYVVGQHFNKAIDQLDWVTRHADQGNLRNLARVRQARLLWAQGKNAAALKLLSHKHPKAYTALYSGLAGDIHAEAGDDAQATAAYHKALQALPKGSDPTQLQRKLRAVANNSGTGDAAGTAGQHQGKHKPTDSDKPPAGKDAS